MNQYPLKAFLKVCKMREEQAELNLSKARSATRDAKSNLQQTITQLEEFKQQRPAQEKELFAQIKGLNITQKRLDVFHLDLKKIADDELELANNVLKAEQHLQHMQEQEELAKSNWQAATREHTKINEHQSIWRSEQKILIERAEEAEMEQS